MTYNDYLSFSLLSYQELAYKKPKSYSKAISCKQSSKWKSTLNEEMDSLTKNKTWMLVSGRPEGKFLVDCEWIYKIDGNIDKEPLRLIAILVTKVFT